MSLADDIESYLEWSQQPRSPYEFSRGREAFRLLEDALQEFYNYEELTPQEVQDAIEKVRKARDLF